MSYIKIPKPTTQVYSKLAKPSTGFTLRAGMATGLLMSLTYAVTRTFGNSYTKIPKPGTQTYTKITKP